MPTDEEIGNMVLRVRERLQRLYATVSDREILHERKKEEHLMNVIREVVRDFYHRFDHGMEEIVKRIRSYFP